MPSFRRHRACAPPPELLRARTSPCPTRARPDPFVRTPKGELDDEMALVRAQLKARPPARARGLRRPRDSAALTRAAAHAVRMRVPACENAKTRRFACKNLETRRSCAERHGRERVRAAARRQGLDFRERVGVFTAPLLVKGARVVQQGTDVIEITPERGALPPHLPAPLAALFGLGRGPAPAAADGAGAPGGVAAPTAAVTLRGGQVCLAAPVAAPRNQRHCTHARRAGARAARLQEPGRRWGGRWGGVRERLG
jgi:hypothetical protein